VIVVDTSVWIEALRSAQSDAGTVLDQLLEADEVALPVPVRVELLSGASSRQRRPLRRALTALPILYPTDETWQLIDRWVEQAHRRGGRFGLGDLLIAAIAHEAQALLWSLDADFERMERLGFVEPYAPDVSRRVFSRPADRRR
jgi:predicted nucleic acid-binding protein